MSNSLPDIMETVINNGVDPSIVPRNVEINLDLVAIGMHEGELERNGSGDNVMPNSEHEGNGGADDMDIQVNDTDYANDAIPQFVPHGIPKDVDMDELIKI